VQEGPFDVGSGNAVLESRLIINNTPIHE
jgi:hypothetical protein